MDCAEMGRMCGENACTDAGGQYSPQGLCMHGANFSAVYYENATGECASLESRCEESGGLYPLPPDASCCGPAFVLLAALGFAAGSPRFK